MPIPLESNAPARRAIAAPGAVAAILVTLLLTACGPRPTPTLDLQRGTALPPPGIALQPAR